MKQLAQIYNPVIPPSIGGDPSGNSAIGGTAAGLIIGNILGAMLIVAFFTSTMFLLTGGFHWITSSGDKANLEHARNKIIHAIIGLMVVASTWAALTIIAPFVGLDFPDIPIPSLNRVLNSGVNVTGGGGPQGVR